MKLYVVGFLFNRNRSEVALIRKNRPEWQAGKLNGIGGKIETAEQPHDAMVREFKEETGFHFEFRWDCFATLNSMSLHGAGSYRVYFYRGFAAVEMLYSVLNTTTDEQVVVLDPALVPFHNTVPNLRWLIPMALTMDADAASQFEIIEHD